jgi:hypothetical protein
MQIRDPQIIRLIDHFGNHYRTNISNRYLRPALLQLSLENQTWDLIEILCEKMDQYRYQGFDLQDLYRQIGAAGKFISVAKRDLITSLRTRLPVDPGSDKVLRDMAVNNFASNLKLFSDLVKELYKELMTLDMADAKGKRPLYKQMPELLDFDQMLME